MTQRPRSDLLHRSLAARQPDRVVVRGEITDQGGNTVILTKRRKRPFEQRGLA